MAKNKTKYHYDRILNIALALLVSFGYVMVVSAHSNVALQHGNGTFVFEIAKITFFLLCGFLLMMRFRKSFSLKWFIKYQGRITIGLVAMMILTLFFPEQAGSQSWIRIPGIMTIQPVEFVKIYLIIVLSYHFSRFSDKDVSVMQILRFPLLLVGGLFGFVFVLQGDLGSAIIIVMIAICIFFAVPEKKYNNAKKITLVLIVVVLALFYIFGPMFADYVYNLPDDSSMKIRLLRIAVLFDPLRDVYGFGYQVTNSLASFSSTGLFGAGLGNSEAKFLIPEPYNDAIIAVIAEELGIVGVLFVFVLYFIIITRLFVYATRLKMILFDRLVLIGIASFFMVQFFVNIGGMVGLIPMTGVTLLFVSSGGSSIFTAFIAIGIAQGIIKRYLK